MFHVKPYFRRKIKVKKIKCRLLQSLFGALRVKSACNSLSIIQVKLEKLDGGRTTLQQRRIWSKDVHSIFIQYIRYAAFALSCPRSPLYHFLSHITRSGASFFTKARLSRLNPPKTHTEVGCIHTMLPQVCLR